MKETYHLRLEDPPGLAILDVAGPKSVKQLVLTRVNVPKKHRGNGHASTLLKMALEDADQEGITLVLGVVPSDGLDAETLTAWYLRNGFEVMEGNILIRKPKLST